MNIFLTGEIQVGKSTIINKFLNTHPNLKIGGFRTISNFDENLGVNGGVYILPAWENELIFNENNQVGNRISGEKAFPEVFDIKGVEILSKDDDFDLILMDEIGFMESKAKDFSNLLISILDKDITVIGVVKDRDNGLPLDVKNHKDSIVLTITEENREDQYIEFTKLVENELNI